MQKYDEAIFKNFNDDNLRVKLVSNRSYCNLILKNYGRVIQDCKFIIEKQPNHIKSYFRWAESLHQLDRLKDSLEIITMALKIEPNAKEFISLQKKVQIKLDKEIKKDELKKLMQTKKMTKLLSNLTNKKILYGQKSSIEKHEIYNREIVIDSSDRIVTSLVFIYPQFGQFDVVEDVSEDTSLVESVKKVVAGGLPWDSNAEYVDFGEMEFYVLLNKQSALNEFRDVSQHDQKVSLHQLDKLMIVNGTLLQIMQIEGFVIPSVPEIIVVSKKSSYYDHFLANFEKILN